MNMGITKSVKERLIPIRIKAVFITEPPVLGTSVKYILTQGSGSVKRKVWKGKSSDP
jgi:hypothetical protein